MFDVFRRNLTVKRKTGGTYNDLGIWENGAEEILEIKASVQKTDAEILQTLPEGYRSKESYVLFTSTELKTVDIGVTNPDRVVINGEDFQVVRVSPWQNINFKTIKHYHVLVVKINTDS